MKTAPHKTLRLGAWALLLLALALPNIAGAVVLDDETRDEIILEDGTHVILYAKAGSTSGSRTREWYYLPPTETLRLATRPDNTPEFLFMKFTEEASEELGGISGAIMHFLMTWGLTPEQHEELAGVLKEKHRGAILKGPVPLEPDDDGGSFRIISATMTDKGLTPSITMSNRAPLTAGDRAAAAARLTAQGAQLMAATFEQTSSIADLSIELNYSFLTLAPAARGRIVIDWSKIRTQSETLEAEYKKWQSGKRVKKVSFLGIPIYKSSTPIYSRSYDEMRREYDFLRERQVIRVEFDQLRDGEATQKMQDAFFQVFMNMVAETSAPDDGVPPPPSDKEKETVPNIKYGRSYKYKKSFVRNVDHRKTQTLVLNSRTSIRNPISMTANLASWYEKASHYDSCVGSVILNDRFFKHRDIRFILDLDAKDLFDEQINYVTVNVRKRRSSGAPFEDSFTIDSKYLEEHGVTAALTYARGEDTDPDAYQYKSQWSLRSGEVYPKNPGYIDGDWEGVTLAPPVAIRTVEVEADLDELEASGITRATVQIHYSRFGKEVVDNIHVSPAQGQPLVAKRIFLDRDMKGYAYRVILNHKRDGKLALEPHPLVNDDYIFVTIPEELRDETSELHRAAKETAVEITEKGKDKILDRFSDLLEGGD